MAEKIFDAKAQGHNCLDELAALPGNHTHNDIAKCSCGKFFTWVSGQRDNYWKKVTEDEANTIVRNANPTLSGPDAEKILNKI